ncbi:MAG: 1,4-dihydroxy-2-naphthoate polyprenyltransferase [Clostridia bacterium]|nr:1,4-dihydroxy-2-naphthoate polyprenyltransferase [Deltaproteobacteria bacterium]
MKPGAIGIWLLAARPRTLPAAIAPVVVGSALAYAHGGFNLGAAFLAAFGAICIQVGTNLFNDYADFRKGADTAERVGPARATQRGWLTPTAVLIGACLVFAVAMISGIGLVVRGGWPIVTIGLASIACGFLYTGGPFPLAYLGIADLFVFVFFGLVAVGGTFYAQTLRLVPQALYAGAALGALSTAVLVVNNLRDRVTDARAGKRTLAVRFGAQFARAEYVFLVATAYAVPVIGVVIRELPIGWLLACLSLPLALTHTRAVMKTDGVALNPYLGRTAQLMLVYGVLLAIGVAAWA